MVDEESAGTGMPDKAMTDSSPMLFIVTVFPPAFGPVITITPLSSPMWTSIGTTSFILFFCTAE